VSKFKMIIRSFQKFFNSKSQIKDRSIWNL
jgi:hypothetical protein